MTGLSSHKHPEKAKRRYPKKTDGGQVKVLGEQFEHVGIVYDKLGRAVHKGEK